MTVHLTDLGHAEVRRRLDDARDRHRRADVPRRRPLRALRRHRRQVR